MAEIDISTHKLAEDTVRAMKGQFTLEDVLAVWHSLGRSVYQNLVMKKGVKLTSLGTFSLNRSEQPIFVMSSALAQKFKIKQADQTMPENIPVTIINFSQLTEGTNLNREQVEKIYSKFITCMGRNLYEGRSVLLSIHRIAELIIENGILKCSFLPTFLQKFEKKGNLNVTQRDVVRTVAKLTTMDLSNQSINTDQYSDNNNTGLPLGSYQDEAPQGKRHSQAASGERNPITGEYGDQPRASSAARGNMNRTTAGRLNNVDQRPSSAGRPNMINRTTTGRLQRPSSSHSVRSMSTASLMHSPRSQASSDAYGRRNSSSGLRREQLDRHNTAQQQRHAQPVDARNIAAQALGTNDIVEKVRKRIIERGGANGIRSISKLFSIMDDNGDKRLSKDELRYGLRDYGVNVTPTELEQVFLCFDRDRNGFLDFNEFLTGLKGEMNERRRKFVRMAFNILDKDRSGVITVDEILSVYDMNWHPEVRAGRKSVKEAAREFMKQWDRIESDGLVTYEEFEDYYKELSASIDDDTYFELMIRNAWRIAGGEGAAANTANRRVLVTNKDGSQSVQTIQNELGMKTGNSKEAMTDVRRRLAQQGMAGDDFQIDMYGGFDSTEKQSGRQPKMNPITGRMESSGRSATQSKSVQPKSAWSEEKFAQPTSGDQSISRRQIENEMLEINSNTPLCRLRKLIYTPPVNMEGLCSKLQVSSVSNNPTITMSAFCKRLSNLDHSLNRNDVKSMWTAVDTKGVGDGSLEVAHIHSILSSKFGKDRTSAKCTGVIDRVIRKILERCGENGGFKALRRTLAIMDDNGNKKLSKDELKYGLADYGIELNMRELDDVFNYFDRDHNGFVDVNEFFIGVRGDMNERRRNLVRMAFDKLDIDGSGMVTADEMLQLYDVSKNPDVVSGRKSKKEAILEFMKQWEHGDGDGVITFAEFEDYYKGISACIDGDDYFELMIRNAWRIAGGEGAAANTANRRVLVTNKDGSQSVQTIQNELGMKTGNSKEAMTDVRRRLAQQGMAGDDFQIDMYGGFDSTERPSGRGSSNRARGNANSRTAPQARGGNGFANAAAKVVRNTHQGGAFERHNAAAKLAAAFRGRQARKQANYEQRKVQAQQKEREIEEIESNRPKARNILRPKGKSYIGF